MRGRGGSAAWRSRPTSRPKASSRFWSWLRKRLAVIVTTPEALIRLPATVASRPRTSSVSDVLAPASKRSWAAVDVLFTCWPPGPDARMNRYSISASSMANPGTMSIIVFA